jgi:hypothetical protein
MRGVGRGESFQGAFGVLESSHSDPHEHTRLFGLPFVEPNLSASACDASRGLSVEDDLKGESSSGDVNKLMGPDG